MDQEKKNILSEVTQTQKDKYHKWLLDINKAKKSQPTINSPREPRQQREP